MASASWRLFSGALRSCLLCLLLLLLPVLTADHRHLVGGWRDRSASDPDVKEAVDCAVQHYNEASNSAFLSRAQEVLQARSQVVEGVNYYLKILMVSTQCDKRSRGGPPHPSLEDCAPRLRAEQRRELCKFYVWDRPWLNETVVTHMNCGPAS